MANTTGNSESGAEAQDIVTRALKASQETLLQVGSALEQVGLIFLFSTFSNNLQQASAIEREKVSDDMAFKALSLGFEKLLKEKTELAARLSAIEDAKPHVVSSFHFTYFS